jgi:hypothetical protein
MMDIEWKPGASKDGVSAEISASKDGGPVLEVTTGGGGGHGIELEAGG